MGEIGGEIGKERILGGLLKTGQTTQYGGYEDDGYFEKGLSKRYTVLTTGQYSGTTNITLNAKTDAHSNNCVYDQRTKLMWSRYVAGSVGPTSDGKLPWTTNVNGEGIFAFAAAANAAKLAGYDDWRIPNIKELISLSNLEVPTPRPDITAFPSGWDQNNFWSSNTQLTLTNNGNCLSFYNGDVVGATKTGTQYVALVRGV